MVNVLFWNKVTIEVNTRIRQEESTKVKNAILGALEKCDSSKQTWIMAEEKLVGKKAW